MYTVMTNDYESCYNCGRPASEWHHIMHGADKKLSEEYGLMIPLCRECHSKVHHQGGELDRIFKRDAQRELLIHICGRCYL